MVTGPFPATTTGDAASLPDTGGIDLTDQALPLIGLILLMAGIGVYALRRGLG